jgi:hypothetical protein
MSMSNEQSVPTQAFHGDARHGGHLYMQTNETQNAVIHTALPAAVGRQLAGPLFARCRGVKKCRDGREAALGVSGIPATRAGSREEASACISPFARRNACRFGPRRRWLAVGWRGASG